MHLKPVGVSSLSLNIKKGSVIKYKRRKNDTFSSTLHLVGGLLEVSSWWQRERMVSWDFAMNSTNQQQNQHWSCDFLRADPNDLSNKMQGKPQLYEESWGSRHRCVSSPFFLLLNEFNQIMHKGTTAMTNIWQLLTPIPGQCTTAVTAPSLSLSNTMWGRFQFFIYLFLHSGMPLQPHHGHSTSSSTSM